MTYNNFDAKIPKINNLDSYEKRMLENCKKYMDTTKKHLSKREFRNALKAVMSLAQEGNKYIDAKAPWKQLRKDKNEAALTFHCINNYFKLKSHDEPFSTFLFPKIG